MNYDELVEIARNDDEIVGLVLTGSRGRGFAVTESADWDVRLIVNDGAGDEYRSRFGTPHGSAVEVVVLSLSEFSAAGAIGSESEWDRFSYVGARVVVDDPERTIACLVSEKSVLPPDVARSVAAERLDDYVNSYYRAAKNLRAGLTTEARLDAVESVAPLLDFLFAVNGRVRPFNRFLRWELERRPLPGVEWSSGALLPMLEAITSSDIGEQQRAFRTVDALARSHGLGDVVDAWEPGVAWLRGD